VNDRGEVKYDNRMRQQVLFTGMNIGSITPTDVDAIIEYHNQGWLWIEVKGMGMKVPYGQRLAMQRFVDDLSDKKDVYAVIAEHHVDNPRQDILLKNCLVREYYSVRNKSWKTPLRDFTVLEFAEGLARKCDENWLKG
jgi:hypothetical protein